MAVVVDESVCESAGVYPVCMQWLLPLLLSSYLYGECVRILAG